MNWIKVTERLPDDEDVLASFKGWDDIEFQRVLYFDHSDNKWYDWSATEHTNVTHWMPLPEPPKD